VNEEVPLVSEIRESEIVSPYQDTSKNLSTVIRPTINSSFETEEPVCLIQSSTSNASSGFFKSLPLHLATTIHEGT
jgi:hypothetical protein